MYTIRTEARFSAAHFLPNYHGKCERLHGHNYRVRAWARGAGLDEGGMLVDFGEVRDALRSVILGLDHCLLNEVAGLGGVPSAENIARYIFERLRELRPDIPFSRVDVFETDASMASWEPD
jgi:6-pyruvoyltetrahydropterin/6-carboxytetrahydropterin synthase